MKRAIDGPVIARVAAERSAPAAIAISNISVTGWDARASSDRRLLRDVDWLVQRGEHWTVIGPNGAGKSTLLNTVRGSIRPSRGSVEILGAPLGAAGFADPLHRVGVIEATSPAFARRMSALEVVLTRTAGSAALRGRRIREEDADRAAALLAGFGCRALGDRRYCDCSRGERQRIHLARALMRDPSLLLFDEPTTGLDLPGREAFLEAMGRLAAERPMLTTVSVTHHVEEIPVSTTHALLLREGRVVAAGPIEDAMSENRLAECFGIAISLSRAGGRWAARTASSW